MKKKYYIKNAFEMVDEIVKIEKCRPIHIRVERISEMRSNHSILGCYFRSSNDIVLNPDLFKLSDKQIYKTILHELGHSIHYNYLQYKPQYLPRKHHGDSDYYCNTNQKESFATCFSDYIWFLYKNKQEKINNSRRLTKMQNILKQL